MKNTHTAVLSAELIVLDVLLVLLVLFCFGLLVYFFYFVKGINSGAVTRSKRSAERFNNYKSASAKITSVEKESYFVRLYERTHEEKEEIPFFIHTDSRRQNAFTKYMLNEINERNRMADKREFRKSIGEPKDKKKEEAEKTRYKVRYEFRADDGESYSGEFYVYEESEKVEEGKYIDIKYNPNNPRANYSSYSAPVGKQ